MLSGVYLLPFRNARGLGAGAPSWAKLLISHWTVSGHYTYQAGQIATWGNVIYLGGDLKCNVQFAGPQLNPTNANFGRITAQANSPRTFQFAVRFKW